MTGNRKLVLMILMLVAVFLAMSPAVNAAKGGNVVRLSRGVHADVKGAARASSFGSGGSIAASICASGSCDCSVCVCYGTSDCCDIGCDVCWAYRDSQGYCAAF
jgi:hypothetical protein